MRSVYIIALSLGLAIPATIASATRPAAAADPAVCAVYAASAVSQNKKNKNMGCGYGGPRWSNNYAGHYGWCLGAPNWAFRPKPTPAPACSPTAVAADR